MPPATTDDFQDRCETFTYETRTAKDYSLCISDDKALERFVARMEELMDFSSAWPPSGRFSFSTSGKIN
jgi:hypothetical protein